MNPRYLNKQLGPAYEVCWSTMAVCGATTGETRGLAIVSLAHSAGTGSRDTCGSDPNFDPLGGLLD